MNQFIKEYKEKRTQGNNVYEAFGMVATHIALRGSLVDLHDVYDCFSEDLLNETNEWLEEAEKHTSNLTSYERDMRLAGHRQGDFL